MKRIYAVFFLLLMLSACSAQAEGVWVEEAWEHVKQELDCDGLPMTVDADVLALTPGMTVREYQTVKQTNAFAREAVASIDWEALDFDISIRQTVSDGVLYYYNGNYQSDRIDSFYGYGTGFYDLDVQYNGRPYTDPVTDMLYELDTSDFGSLTWEDIMKRAESAAEVLNVQIGQPRSMKRMESYLADNEGRIPSFFVSEYGYTAEELEQASTIEVFMPVYYQGMRLYSGAQVGLPGESRMLEPHFSLRLHRDGWLVSVYCPLFNGWTPKGEEATPLTFDEALEKLRQAYANMYLPNVAGITVHEAALEYVPLSSDDAVRNGFTVYPAWVFRIEMTQRVDDEEENFMEYVAIHAVTGETIF